MLLVRVSTLQRREVTLRIATVTEVLWEFFYNAAQHLKATALRLQHELKRDIPHKKKNANYTTHRLRSK